jgi:hypothetical protein
MKQLDKQQLFEFFEEQKKEHYKKRGRFLYRPAIQNETVLTIVSGKLETLKKANNEDIILRNIELGSSAETYIIAKNIFEKRYVITEENHMIDNQKWTVVLAKGEVEAFCYSGDLTFHIGCEEQSIQFMATWNEMMICNPGDYIARPLGNDNKFDIYRIEKDTFNMTYTKKV